VEWQSLEPGIQPGRWRQPSGVTATSASNAWAVGCANCGTQSEKILIVQWNGTSWRQVQSPAPVSTSALFSAAATSASNAWAVGCMTNCLTAGINQLLILRWNGTSWKQVPSPAHIYGELTGVTAVSGSNAWAVGGHYTSSGSTIITKTLTLRWNGTAWQKVPSPSPGASAGLSGVAAASAGSAWAVGGCYTSLTSSGKTLVEQWNGKTWK
jgi:hypothetical protein